MGAFAAAVQAYLRDALAQRRDRLAWTTEHRIGSTPVDIVGRHADRLVAVELEWRRADPADNTAKLFRHLEAGVREEFEQVTVVQVFSGYYDLASGGVSSKRHNAEFVGSVAERALNRVAYHAVDFDLDPPKRGAGRPDGWHAVADRSARRIDGVL